MAYRHLGSREGEDENREEEHYLINFVRLFNHGGHSPWRHARWE